jgi:hypothetical protein
MSFLRASEAVKDTEVTVIFTTEKQSNEEKLIVSIRYFVPRW